MMLKTLYSFILIALLIPASVYAIDDCSTIMSQLESAKVEADFLREWGVKLLTDEDPTFSDSKYRKKLESALQPGTIGYSPMLSTKFNPIYSEYTRDFSNTDPYMPQILRFTNTGTEANNALYEYAEYSFFKRTGKKAKRPSLLYFGAPYGGSFGRIAEIGVRYKTDPNIESKFHIPTPYTRNLTAWTPEESAHLEDRS
jgi:hypothetical protein